MATPEPEKKRKSPAKLPVPQPRARRKGGSASMPSGASLTPLAAALRVFDKAAKELGLNIQERLKILNTGRSLYFTLLKEADPVLDVDRRDRLGYFLGIYELCGRLVGSAPGWLRAPNSAAVFGGKPPLERILGGRMEDLLATLTYLKGAYGGWA
jgi:hypothetical protein